MPNWIICAATSTSGVRHRLTILSALKHFADARNFAVLMYWPVSAGVCFSRFEELFAPIPGITVRNLPVEHLGAIQQSVASGARVILGKQRLPLHQPGQPNPRGTFFSWDLSGAWSLAKMVPGRPPAILALPSRQIRARADHYVRLHDLAHRLGIRVRVEELPYRDRKPHRIKRELDQVIRSLIRIPWYARVFIATDSEYIQQALASHFIDHKFLPKNFDLEESTGRYIHRLDKHAMFTFMQEVECLRLCNQVINIGGFLNDHSVANKILPQPYIRSPFLNPLLAVR